MKMLIGDTPNQDYEDFLLQTMELLTTEKVKSMAVVVFTEGEALTGYWRMGCMDKAYAAANIQADSVDEMIRVNKERYFNNESEENSDE